MKQTTTRLCNMMMMKLSTCKSRTEPPADCGLCARLKTYRKEIADIHPDWFNAPVPSFGSRDAELLIVGLAPGVTGANKTGRPFTGDYAGDLLYATLLKFELATGTYGARADDGLKLSGTMITNAVRCVPPQNKPVGQEMAACRPFLKATIERMPKLRVILALGLIAHNNTLSALGEKRAPHKFAHNAAHEITGKLTLIDSYHCSRYNTNTRRLTTQMFEDVFVNIEQRLKQR